MPSGEEGSWPPGEKSGTKPVASQDSPQEQITETPQAQVTLNPPQMSTSASALQTEESADEKADTMEKHDKLDHNADDNPVIKEKDSTFNQNQDDAQNETSETNVRSMTSADMTQEKLTTNQDPFSLMAESNTEVYSPSEVANVLSEQIKHIDSNNAKLPGKEESPKQVSKNINEYRDMTQEKISTNQDSIIPRDKKTKKELV